MTKTVVIVAALVGFGNSAFAMDGVFDRTAEVDKYIETIKTGTRNTLTDTARDIRNADIGDARLAAALHDKLRSEVPTLDPKNGVDGKYRKAMVNAIASTGVAEYGKDLSEMCAGLKSMHSQTFCDEAKAKMEWYHKKNETMASRQYYKEGDDPKVARIMNLIMSDDFSMKLEGASKMNWGKILDPRLMDAIEPQVLQFMDSTTHKDASSAQINAMAGFVKLLGFSGNPKYRDTLVKVQKSKAGQLIQKRAKEAVHRLDL